MPKAAGSRPAIREMSGCASPPPPPPARRAARRGEVGSGDEPGAGDDDEDADGHLDDHEGAGDPGGLAGCRARR